MESIIRIISILSILLTPSFAIGSEEILEELRINVTENIYVIPQYKLDIESIVQDNITLDKEDTRLNITIIFTY